MKKPILILVFFITTYFAFTQSPTFQWAKSMSGPSPFESEGNSIILDALNNVYTIGEFTGTVDFDPGVGTSLLTSNGAYDVFISKLDAFGNFLWAKQVGGSLPDFGNSIGIDSQNNIIITGRFQGTADFDPGIGLSNLTAIGNDVFILKLDPLGNFVWVKQLKCIGSSIVGSMSIDQFDNIYTAGYFDATVDFDPGTNVINLTPTGSYEVFISKLDVNGNFVWANKFGGTGVSAFGGPIKVDSFGNVYTTGSFIGTADFDPGPGIYNLTSNGTMFGDDIFITKLGPNGNFIWAKRMGSSFSDSGNSITIDALGNVYTIGYFSTTVDFDPGAGIFNLTAAGNTDIFISKLNSSGNFIWAKNLGGNENDIGRSIVLDTFMNIYTTGYYAGLADFNPNAGVFNLVTTATEQIFVSKLDSAGNFIWAVSMNGGNSNRGNSITIDASNNIYSTGFYQTTVDFDPGTGIFNLSALGIRDAFVHKMGQPSVGLKENDLKNNISIYPNPTNGIINIEASTNSANDKLKIEISNIIGQVLISENQTNQRSSFNIQNFPSGLYFIKVINEGNVIETKKIIKE